MMVVKLISVCILHIHTLASFNNTYLTSQQYFIGKFCQLADATKVRTLMTKSKCDFDVRSARKKTPLHCAVIGGSVTIVEFLLRKGADPLAKDDLQKTPLDYAETFEEDTKIDDAAFIKTNKSIIKVLERYKKLSEAKARFASKKITEKKKTTSSFAEFRAKAKSNLGGYGGNKGASSKTID